MKVNDIITIAFISIIGAALSIFAVNSLLGDIDEKSVSFNVPMTITTALAEPDAEIYNLEAINPTVEVYVGNCKDDDHDGILSEAELEECGESNMVTDNIDNEQE